METESFRILIVDDEPKNIQVLGNLLNELEFKTGFATTGRQAIELLNKTPYDLVLLDINMPELDGYDTCKIIRRTEELKDTPIIFLTANTSTEQVVKGFEAGGQDYITKPFNTTELIARIKTQIELSNSRKTLKKYNRQLEELAERRTIELSEALSNISSKNEELIQKKEAAISMAQDAHEARRIAERAREAMEESEERFRLLSESSIVGVFIFQDDVWVYVNPFMANYLGYEQEEMIGQSPFVIIHPDYHEFVKNKVAGKFAKGNVGSYEAKCICKNGEIRFVEIISHAITYKGKPALIGNAIDITERKINEMERTSLLENLEYKHNQLQVISNRLLEVQEEEKRNIARELHDEIGQTLSALKLNLQIIKSSIKEDEVQTKLELGIGMANQLLSQVRNISLTLHPTILDDLGFSSAVHWLIERLNFDESVFFNIDISIDDTEIKSIERPLFRILQEALTNIRKHSGATIVKIQLAKENNTFTLIINDNGKGFDVDASYKKAISGRSLGLLSMQERAQLAGGFFDINSKPMAGVTIKAAFKIN